MGLLTGQNTTKYSQYTADQFTANGTQTIFNLTRTPPTPGSLIVTIDGVKQHSSTYAIGTNQIIFSEAPPTGSAIECIAIGSQGIAFEPGDQSISTQKLINGSITPEKMDTASFDGTGAIKIPSGTTAQRPVGLGGHIRHNSTTGLIEYWDTKNNSWIGIGEFIAQGGNITQAGGYTYHTFTSSGSFQIISGYKEIQYLVVAGGGGGGNSDVGTYENGSGAGAGGYIASSVSLGVGNYPIIIGAGGNGSAYPPTNGDNSVAFGNTAIGGGRGASHQGYNANSGGSGGGGGNWIVTNNFNIGASGTTGQGNAGGNAGQLGDTNGGSAGGGGAGAVGQSVSSTIGGNGGIGRQWLDGNYYAGGGAGGGGTGGTGGLGGGGNGGNSSATSGSNGAPNTGGGGGGNFATGSNNNSGGNGGSGVVIVRYLS